MDDRAALLRAVCEHPDDDAPRLVFADWLDEHGEPERAEHVRLQVRHAELWANPGRRFDDPAPEAAGRRPSRQRLEAIRQLAIAEVRRRERELWAAHGAGWRADLPALKGVEWFAEFHRGFTERMTVADDGTLVRHAEAFELQPVRHLTVRRFTGVKGFAALPWVCRLKAVYLDGVATDVGVDELIRCGKASESLLVSVRIDGRAYARRRSLQRVFGDRLSWAHW